MIDAHRFGTERVRRAYNRRSGIYAKTVAPMERGYHLEALRLAAAQPGERVLDVAVGPGLSTVDLARAAGPETPVHAVDLSEGMLRIAQRNAEEAGVTNIVFAPGDATALPFGDGQFDLLYNAYMLDLIPFERIPNVLSEFHRVLKPGGRLVMLNMSKRDEATRTGRERLYRWLPRTLVLYLMGGCRPVLARDWVEQAGFQGVERHFLDGKMPSEVVTAFK